MKTIVICLLLLSTLLGSVVNKNSEKIDDKIMYFSTNRLDRKINLIEFELNRITFKQDSITNKK